MWVAVLAASVALAAAGCSSDAEPATTTQRGKLEFGTPPPGATRLGLCKAYQDDQIKGVLGEDGFRKLAPSALGEEGDAATGESCRWVRSGGGDDSLSLTIEALDYGADLAGLEAKFTELEGGTIGSEVVEGLGDAAFSSASEETSILQVRTGQYLLTLSTQARGKGVEPLDPDTLKILAGAALEKLS